MPDGRDRLIVALDLPTAAQALQIVSAVGDSARIYKVGKQLFTAEGPQVLRRLVASGRQVFLDLKFHDIPNTVAAAVREASKLGVSMLTIHASGGLSMIQAAVQAAAREANRVEQGFSPADSGSPNRIASSLPKAGAQGAPSRADFAREGVEEPQAERHKQIRPLILAVTVLTSLNDEDLQEIGVSGRVLDQALRLGALARTAGCDGIIASAREARELRRELGAGFLIVTPGIRPAAAPQSKDDQARVVTPSEAISAGASHLVVGRPITAAPDPSAAARRIVEEIESALAVQAH